MMEALDVDQTTRNQTLRADLGKLQETVSRWTEQGTFRYPHAQKKLREELQRIAEKYNDALRKEAESARQRVKTAQADLQRQVNQNAGAEQLRAQEMQFRAQLAQDNELSGKLAGFAEAKDRIEAVTHFAGWHDVTATFAEAKRRGLSTADVFAKAWREAGDPPRVMFDQPSVIKDMQRAERIESLPAGTALIRRPDADGEEMPVPIGDLVSEEPLREALAG